MLIPSREQAKERDGQHGPDTVKTEILRDPMEGHTMIKFIKNFRKDENGAVTVDWVVLTAAVVGLGVAAYAAIEDETTQLAADIGATIAAENVSSTSSGSLTGTAGAPGS